MPTPLERLSKIVSAKTPAVVKFKCSTHSGRTLNFQSVIVEESRMTVPTEDKELFDLLSSMVGDKWDESEGKYVVASDVDSLWRHVLNNLIYRYEKNSSRCNATKRKTTDFIQKIKIDDKLLSEFILQTYIKVNSSDFSQMSAKDRVALFEQFDSLRRTFGKRV